jgi:uncharacterized protein YdaU (DUF1376 family)
MHYFQFNIGDYASHTRHLSLLEDLAYRRLLDVYYLKDGALVGTVAEVARQIGMREHIPEVEQVLQDFFIADNQGGWGHIRCDAEIAHFRDKSLKASNAGKASAERRNNGRSTDVQPTNNHKPITTNHELNITTKVVCASGDAPALLPEHIVEEWNKTSAKMGKPKVRNLTPERRQNLKARIGQYSIDDFHEVFSKIERSAFLRGETQGWPRGATFDWTFKKANFQKILEGNYDS